MSPVSLPPREQITRGRFTHSWYTMVAIRAPILGARAGGGVNRFYAGEMLAG
jgi:hypothetical protein